MPWPLIKKALPWVAGGLGLLGAARGGRARGARMVEMPRWTPEQQRVATPFARYLEERIGKGLPRFEGERVAPLTEAEELGQTRLLDWLRAGPEALRRPMLREWEEVTRPAIREAFVGPGTFWSPMRARAEALGAERLGERLGALEVGFAPHQAEVAMQLGATPRLIAQQMLDAEFQEFLRTQPEISPVIQQAMAFLAQPGQQHVYKPREPAWWEHILPPVAGLAGAWGAPGWWGKGGAGS